jgi:hypothetical protein
VSRLVFFEGCLIKHIAERRLSFLVSRRPLLLVSIGFHIHPPGKVCRGTWLCLEWVGISEPPELGLLPGFILQILMSHGSFPLLCSHGSQ